MAMACEICGKKPSFGNTISHAHNVTASPLEPEFATRASGDRRRAQEASPRLHLLHPRWQSGKGRLKFARAGRSPA